MHSRIAIHFISCVYMDSLAMHGVMRFQTFSFISKTYTKSLASMCFSMCADLRIFSAIRAGRLPFGGVRFQSPFSFASSESLNDG